LTLTFDLESKNRWHDTGLIKNAASLASCLIYAWSLLECVIFIMWVRSFIKMLLAVKFAEDRVLIFLILREKC